MPDLLDSADPSRGDRPVELPVQDHGEQAHGPQSVGFAPPALLHFRHVSKWYGPVIGVNQVTLELRPGITGLVGANGAGKSTLMKLATGYLRPDIGAVSVLGHDAWSPAAKVHVAKNTTMAHLVLAVALDFARTRGFGDLTDGRPQLTAWLARMHDLPSLRATATRA